MIWEKETRCDELSHRLRESIQEDSHSLGIPCSFCIESSSCSWSQWRRVLHFYSSFLLVFQSDYYFVSGARNRKRKADDGSLCCYCIKMLGAELVVILFRFVHRFLASDQMKEEMGQIRMQTHSCSGFYPLPSNKQIHRRDSKQNRRDTRLLGMTVTERERRGNKAGAGRKRGE